MHTGSLVVVRLSAAAAATHPSKTALFLRACGNDGRLDLFRALHTSIRGLAKDIHVIPGYGPCKYNYYNYYNDNNYNNYNCTNQGLSGPLTHGLNSVRGMPVITYSLTYSFINEEKLHVNK